MGLYDFFYNRTRLDEFAARLGTVNKMTDKVEQLLACNQLSKDFDTANVRTPLGQGIIIASALVFCAALTGGIVFAPASALLYGFAGGSVLYTAMMLSYQAAKPFRAFAERVEERQVELQEGIAISEVVASSQLEKVLSIFPSIKSRFADTAVRAMIKGEAPQSDVTKRLIIEKPAAKITA